MHKENPETKNHNHGRSINAKMKEAGISFSIPSSYRFLVDPRSLFHYHNPLLFLYPLVFTHFVRSWEAGAGVSLQATVEAVRGLIARRPRVVHITSPN